MPITPKTGVLFHAYSHIDGSRHLVEEATALTGGKYEDLQLVIGRSTKPQKLRKQLAYLDPEFKERMGTLTRAEPVAPVA